MEAVLVFLLRLCLSCLPHATSACMLDCTFLVSLFAVDRLMIMSKTSFMFQSFLPVSPFPHGLYVDYAGFNVYLSPFLTVEAWIVVLR